MNLACIFPECQWQIYLCRMNEPDSPPQEFNQVREDLLFTSYRSCRSEAIGNEFIVILWVYFFVFVSSADSRTSAVGISMVVGVFVEIPKKGQMLYLELHLDYCRH